VTAFHSRKVAASAASRGTLEGQERERSEEDEKDQAALTSDNSALRQSYDRGLAALREVQREAQARLEQEGERQMDGLLQDYVAKTAERSRRHGAAERAREGKYREKKEEEEARLAREHQALGEERIAR
jgi:hypothetical protein